MYMLLLHVCTMYQSQNLMVATQISDDDIVIIFFKFKTSTCMAGFIKKKGHDPISDPLFKITRCGTDIAIKNSYCSAFKHVLGLFKNYF